MLTISPERVMDIHLLNQEFLQLAASAQSGGAFGLDDETFEELKSLSDEMIVRVAAVDRLLFTVGDRADSVATDPVPQGVPLLVERMRIIVRDFAREDPGLAVSYLNASRDNCSSLLKMGFSQIRETSQAETIKIIPLGTTAFRMLAKLATPSERTQYVALAANDD